MRSSGMCAQTSIERGIFSPARPEEQAASNSGDHQESWPPRKPSTGSPSPWPLLIWQFNSIPLCYQASFIQGWISADYMIQPSSHGSSVMPAHLVFFGNWIPGYDKSTRRGTCAWRECQMVQETGFVSVIVNMSNLVSISPCCLRPFEYTAQKKNQKKPGSFTDFGIVVVSGSYALDTEFWIAKNKLEAKNESVSGTQALFTILLRASIRLKVILLVVILQQLLALLLFCSLWLSCFPFCCSCLLRSIVPSTQPNSSVVLVCFFCGPSLSRRSFLSKWSSPLVVYCFGFRLPICYVVKIVKAVNTIY